MRDRDLPAALPSLVHSLRLAHSAAPRLLALALLVTVVSALPDIGAVIAIAEIFQAQDERRGGLLAAAVAVLVVIVIVGWLAGVLLGRVMRVFGERVTVAIEAHVAHLHATAPGVEHLEREAYVNRLTVLRDQVFAFSLVYRSIFQTAATCIRAVLTLAVLVSVAPWFGLLGLVALAPIQASAITSARTREVQELVAGDARRAQDLFLAATAGVSARDILAANWQGYVMQSRGRHFSRYLASVSRSRRRAMTWQAAAWGFFAAAYSVSLYVATRSGAPAGDIVLLAMAGGRVAQFFGEFVNEAGFLRADWLGVAQRLLWLEQYAQAREGAQPALSCPAVLRSGITLSKVSFRYPGTERPVLQDLSVTLPAGAVIALVGENGAGKSSLIKLLCRLYEPTEGRILVDDVPLERIDSQEWRRALSGAFQDFVRFEFTLRDAVQLSDQQCVGGDAAVVRALGHALGEDLVTSLPQGLDTQLGGAWPGGRELSHGQWQKIAVARGVHRQEPLLLFLDEPTSAFDPEAEHELLESLRGVLRSSGRASRGGIVLLVTHRLSLVRSADLVVCLGPAGTSEVGTHSDLVNRKGSYAQMYQLQGSAYGVMPPADLLSTDT